MGLGLLFLRTSRLRFWKYSKRKVEGWQWKQMTGVSATVQSSPNRMNQGSTIIQFIRNILNELSFDRLWLQQTTATRTVVQLLQPTLHALRVHQAAAAAQRQRLPGGNLLEADLALGVVLEEGVREVAVQAVFVDPPQDLSFLREGGGVAFAFAFAADADEDVDEDYAREEGDVAIGHHRVVSIVLQCPVLAIRLRLAGEGVSSAAMLPINLSGVVQRADQRAGQVRGVLRGDVRLVQRDGGGCVYGHGQKDDQDQIKNNEESSFPAGGEFGAEAVLAEEGEIGGLGLGTGASHRGLNVNNTQQYYQSENWDCGLRGFMRVGRRDGKGVKYGCGWQGQQVLTNRIIYELFPLLSNHIIIKYMQNLLRILEDSITYIGDGRAAELERFYSNPTLDERIKNIIRKMETIGGGDGGMILLELNNFRENLIINNTEGIQHIIGSKNSPKLLCDNLKEIYDLFDNNTRQLSLDLDCLFFYKEMIQMIVNDKEINEDIVNNHKSIPEDRRYTIISLMRKMAKMKEEMGELKHQVKEMEELLGGNRGQVKEMEEELVRLNNENRKFKEAMKEKEAEIEKTKVAKQKELKMKNDEIKTLQKNLENQRKELQSEKNEIAKQKKEIIVQRSEIMKQSEIKGKDNEAKIIQLQDKVKKLQKKKKESQKKATEKQESMQKQIDNQRKEIENLQKFNESIKEENQKLAESSKAIELDNSLADKAKLLIETAEIVNSLFGKSSHNMKSSIVNSQIGRNYPSFNQVQTKKHLKDQYFHNDTACNAFLKELKQPTHADVIYQYPQDKHIAFAERIKSKKNILLICKTESGSVVGGYTEIGFAKAKPKEVSKCFIFAAKGEQCIVLRNKKGKAGVTQDSDFLIFGCEQLTLQRNCSYATSYYLNYESSNLQFQGTPQLRQKFQEISGSITPSHKIPLLSYELLELSFSK